jgi:hypothetical protein
MESLRVMGFGMLGIFTVAVVLMLIMFAITKLFPAGRENEQAGGDSSADDD